MGRHPGREGMGRVDQRLDPPRQRPAQLAIERAQPRDADGVAALDLRLDLAFDHQPLAAGNFAAHADLLADNQALAVDVGFVAAGDGQVRNVGDALGDRAKARRFAERLRARAQVPEIGRALAKHRKDMATFQELIDREAIARTLYGGLASPASGPSSHASSRSVAEFRAFRRRKKFKRCSAKRRPT